MTNFENLKENLNERTLINAIETSVIAAVCAVIVAYQIKPQREDLNALLQCCQQRNWDWLNEEAKQSLKLY